MVLHDDISKDIGKPMTGLSNDIDMVWRDGYMVYNVTMYWNVIYIMRCHNTLRLSLSK
jgi:hypothetical protein